MNLDDDFDMVLGILICKYGNMMRCVQSLRSCENLTYCNDIWFPHCIRSRDLLHDNGYMIYLKLIESVKNKNMS